MVELRALEHPDLWDFVVHLTGRPGATHASVDPSIARMTPSEKLASILQAHEIRATRPFGTPAPVACFTESTPAGLEYLVGRLGYAPWGIVFSKAFVYGVGGAPVHYVRGDEWDEYQQLPVLMRSRAVRFEPGESEWMHEREWRAPGTGSPAALRFTPHDVHAVIIGKVDWPDPEFEYRFTGDDWDWDTVEPQWAAGFRRWVWSGTSLLQFKHWPQDFSTRR